MTTPDDRQVPSCLPSTAEPQVNNCPQTEPPTWTSFPIEKCVAGVDRKRHIPSDLVVDQWVSNVESSSPRDFLLLHDLWTMFRHLLWSQITSAISMAWDFTTKSGGIWDFFRHIDSRFFVFV